MKYINILNFTDACSDALLRFLDYDDGFYSLSSEHNILINIKSKRNKNKFIKRIEDVVYESTSFGSTLLLCNSCHPRSNWRLSSQTIPLSKRYDISDESIMICPPFLEEAIQTGWKQIKATPQIKKIEVDTMDAKDIVSLIVDQLGEQFIRILKPKIDLITEINDLFIRNHLHDDIPDYFKLTIENLLLKLNIN